MVQTFDGIVSSFQITPDAFSKKKAEQFAPFLNVLCEASEYASDLSSSLWEFGVPIAQAKAMGLNENDLQWMVKKGWISFQPELGDGDKLCFSNAFCPETCFVIATDSVKTGCRAAGSQFHLEILDDLDDRCDVGEWGENVTPVWDVSRRELLIGGELVKRFRWPAPNQQTILSVFSEEDWPARIVDPLPQGDGLDPKRRLSDTIKCLNRNQHQNLIRFRGDGTGEGVFWEAINTENFRSSSPKSP